MLRILLVLFGFLAPVLLVPSSAQAQTAAGAGCGGRLIEIADLQWPSATILAHVHQQIIGKAFNCQTKIVVSDIAAVTTTVKTTQKPTLIPEMWPTRVAEKWNQMLDARAAFLGGSSFDITVLEGWYVPSKVVADFPALKNVKDVGALAERYQLSTKPKFISCPPTWACALINRNMLKAYGLAEKFDIIEPQNRIAMDQLIGQMVSANTPVVFYYWQPNALISQLDVTPLSFEAFDPDAYRCLAQQKCDAVKPTAYPQEQIQLVLAEWVRGDAPELVPYARKAQMPLKIMNDLMAKMVDEGLSAQEIAQFFVDEYQDIWQNWLPQIN